MNYIADYYYYPTMLHAVAVTLMFDCGNSDDYAWYAGHVDDYGDGDDITLLVENRDFHIRTQEIWTEAINLAREEGHSVR